MNFMEMLEGQGALLDPASGRPLHFGDPAVELSAALQSCALAERSHLGRVLATGPDLLDLLNRMSTNAVKELTEGQGRATTLTSSKGRIVERLFVHHLGRPGVLLIAGDGGGGRTIAHLNKYTFSEDTGLQDVTGSWFQFAILGPRAGDVLEAAGLPRPAMLAAAPAEVRGARIHVLGQDSLSTEGFSVTGPAEKAPLVWTPLAEAIRAAGGRPAGDQAVEAWRVLRGLPASGHELTEAHNPLEAGLWDTVDFDKGCYVGQEVVARLRTYDKVSRVIRGFLLPEGSPSPDVGTPLFDGTRKVGEVTSALVPPGRSCPVALAYVKRSSLDAGGALHLGSEESTRVTLLDLPFRDTP